jgi:hypothetical protein
MRNMRLSIGHRALAAIVSALLVAACTVVITQGGGRKVSLLQSADPVVQKDIQNLIKDAFKPDVVELSKKIDASLHALDSVNLKAVDASQASRVLAKANKAISDVKLARDIASHAQIAAAKSDVFLLNAEKSKKLAISRSSDATHAAAAATAAALALKSKLVKAQAESRRLSDSAKEAHSAYLASKSVADNMKSKAEAAHKQVVAAEQASETAAAQASAAKAKAALAAAALAKSSKDCAAKKKALDELNAAVLKARAVRDAAAVAAHKAAADAERVKSANSARLAAAQKAEHAAKADLYQKVAAAHVASNLLKVSGQIRRMKQSAAVAADVAFVKASDALKALQLKATKSLAASRDAQVASVKAAHAANDALKKFLARKQSSMLWPGKKPVLSDQ